MSAQSAMVVQPHALPTDASVLGRLALPFPNLHARVIVWREQRSERQLTRLTVLQNSNEDGSRKLNGKGEDETAYASRNNAGRRSLLPAVQVEGSVSTAGTMTVQRIAVATREGAS